MKGKLGAALFCLLFAVPFGGIGAFASWMIGKMVYDGSRAAEWVKVRATVEGPETYQYSFDGRKFQGTRLGLEPLGASDTLDDWHEAMADHFATAMAQKKPITVYVNPDRPDESVVDREIRWKLVMFMSVFALAFGGVGVATLYVAGRTLFSKGRPGEARRPRASRSEVQVTGLGGLWGMTFLWNVISIPTGFLVVPDAVAKGEWGMLIFLLFPLMGLLLLWGAIAATFVAVRAKLAPAPSPPQVPAAPRPAAGDGFARGMIGDKASVAAGGIDTSDDGLPRAPDRGIAR